MLIVMCSPVQPSFAQAVPDVSSETIASQSPENDTSDWNDILLIVLITTLILLLGMGMAILSV